MFPHTPLLYLSEFSCYKGPFIFGRALSKGLFLRNTKRMTKVDNIDGITMAQANAYVFVFFFHACSRKNVIRMEVFWQNTVSKNIYMLISL